MRQKTRVFRIFVSSTFSDMREERGILQAEVFPALEKLCASKGASFQAVDLRWGVNEESQTNQQTMDICLGEIARCQRISPRPNFIILLGDRYGWQPIPGKIPAAEMEFLVPALKAEDRPLVDEWYRLDENALPQEYVLQPRTGEFKRFEAWALIETSLRAALRHAADSSTLEPERRIKYFTSATHQEIVLGALFGPAGPESPTRHVYAYERSIEGLPTDGSASAFIESDPEDSRKLEALKDELSQGLGPNYHRYQAVWDGHGSKMRDARAFAHTVEADLRGVIESQLAAEIGQNEEERERSLHREFKNELIRHFDGRNDELKLVEGYLAGSAEGKCLAIVGASGSGKSSFIAKAIDEAERNVLGSKTFLAFRFLGISTDSSTPGSLLSSLVSQIAAAFGLSPALLAGKGGTGFPGDETLHREAFRTYLGLATEARPIILFVDALNELRDADGNPSLDWLPMDLPSHVRVIVSLTPESAESLDGAVFLQLPLLSTGDGRTILRRWLSASGRRLSPEQEGAALASCGKELLAIRLKLIFESVRHWHSYDTALPSRPDLEGAFDDYFGWLEGEHTKALVSTAIGYLVSGRYSGLAESEILDLLFFDEEYWEHFLKTSHPDHRAEIAAARKLPIIVWSRLFLDLEPYVTERDADGVAIIGFFHQQFVEYARRRYLPSERHSEVRHSRLAAYYGRSPTVRSADSTIGRPNIRKLAEQAWQETTAGMFEAAMRTLTYFAFLKAKCKAGMATDLAFDYAYLEARMKASRQRTSRVPIGTGSALEPLPILPFAVLECKVFFERHKFVLRRDPSLLLPLAYNSSSNGALAEFAAAQIDPANLKQNPWILLAERPTFNPFPAAVTQLAGHTRIVGAVVITQDESHVVSGGLDDSIRIWHLDSGTCRRVIQCGQKGVTSLAVTPDGKRIVSGGSDGRLLIWDDAGNVIGELRGHEGPIFSVAITSAGDRIVSAGKDRIIVVWDLLPGNQAKSHRLGGHPGKINCVHISKDERFLLSADGESNLICLWNLETFQKIRDIFLKKGPVQRVFLDRDDNILAACMGLPAGNHGYGFGLDQSGIRLWNFKSLLGLAEPDTAELFSVEKLPTFVRGGRAGTIGSIVYDVEVSPDASYAISGGFDRKIYIWDLRGSRLAKTFSGHTDTILQTKLAPGKGLVVSSGFDGTLRVWSTRGADSESLEEGTRRIGAKGKGLVPERARFGELLWSNLKIRTKVLHPLLSLLLALCFYFSCKSLEFPLYERSSSAPLVVTNKNLEDALTTLLENPNLEVFGNRVPLEWFPGMKTRKQGDSISVRFAPFAIVYAIPFFWFFIWYSDILKRAWKSNPRNFRRLGDSWLRKSLKTLTAIPFGLCFRGYKCPLCGELIVGSRGLFLCGSCGWSDSRRRGKKRKPSFRKPA